MRRWAPPLLGLAIGLLPVGRTRAGSATAVGLAQPLQLVATAPDGRWVLFCQGPGSAGATAEDPLGETFALQLAGADGHARPLRADAVVALDATGHRMVLRRAEDLVLLDLWTAREESLGSSPWTRGTADGHADGLPYASFDAAGRRLLYPRAGDGRPVVRDLQTGAWFAVESSTPTVLDPGGDHVWVWPDVPLFTAPRGVHDGICSRPPTDAAAWLPPGLPGASLVAVAWPHRQQDATGVVAILGGAMLLRDADGALYRREGDEDSLVAPASCGAHLQHLDRATGQVIVSCGDDRLLVNRGGASVPIVGAFPRPISVDVPRTGRWLAVDGWDAVDTVTGSRLTLEAGQRLGLAVGQRALILRSGEAPVWRDLDTGETHTLPAASVVSAAPPAGDWLAMRVSDSEGLLWNVATNTGRPLQGVPLAVTADGRVLLGVKRGGVVEGPLWWEDAESPDPLGKSP